MRKHWVLAVGGAVLLGVGFGLYEAVERVRESAARIH
jgi:hypothetical protein